MRDYDIMLIASCIKCPLCDDDLKCNHPYKESDNNCPLENKSLMITKSDKGEDK